MKECTFQPKPRINAIKTVRKVSETWNLYKHLKEQKAQIAAIEESRASAGTIDSVPLPEPPSNTNNLNRDNGTKSIGGNKAERAVKMYTPSSSANDSIGISLKMLSRN